MLKEQIQSGELKDKIGYIEMSLNESLKKLEQENMQLKQIIVVLNGVITLHLGFREPGGVEAIAVAVGEH